MQSATAYSICSICGERHARGAPHVWKDAAPKSNAVRPEAKPPGGGSVNSPRRQPRKGRDQEKRDAGPGESPGATLPNVARGGALIAPPNECAYCDARRAYTAERMRKSRKKDAP